MLFFSRGFRPLLLLVTISVNFLAVKVTTLATTPTAEKVAQEITIRIEGTAQGSGVIVERVGTIYKVLTNAHVVQKKGTYALVTPDGKCHSIESSTIQLLPELDLAIFLFKSSFSYEVAQLGDTEKLTAGQKVYVGGWAHSGGRLHSRVFLTSQGELTEINSQLPFGYSLTYTNLVRVGMSGGPILNQKGQLLGINGLVRLAANSDKIVASGINIDQFLRYASGQRKTVPVPSESLITCPLKYIY